VCTRLHDSNLQCDCNAAASTRHPAHIYNCIKLQGPIHKFLLFRSLFFLHSTLAPGINSPTVSFSFCTPFYGISTPTPSHLVDSVSITAFCSSSRVCVIIRSSPLYIVTADSHSRSTWLFLLFIIDILSFTPIQAAPPFDFHP
jgi:hypothetical protein